MDDTIYQNKESIDLAHQGEWCYSRTAQCAAKNEPAQIDTNDTVPAPTSDSVAYMPQREPI